MRWTAVKYRRIVVAAFNSRTRWTAVHQDGEVCVKALLPRGRTAARIQGRRGAAM